MKKKKYITEELLTKILMESIQEAILKELDINFGQDGNIPLCPVRRLTQDISPMVIQRVMAKGEEGVAECAQQLEGTLLKRVYDQYKNSFAKRRSGEERSFQYFANMIIKNSWHGLKLYYFESEGSYMFGTYKGGVFLCSHLAPKDTVKALARLIMKMSSYDNVVFAITDDLSPMFERIGMPKFSSKVQCHFRNHDVQKDVYGTTLNAAAIGAKVLGFTNLDFNRIMNNGFTENDINLIESNPDLALELLQDVNLNKLLKYMPNNFIQMMDGIVTNFLTRGIES